MVVNRFVIAQNEVYSDVLKELHSGKKKTHWMWFIFPQILGLGDSEISNFYSIQNIYELKAYAKNPILSKRLIECFKILLSLKKDDAVAIFGELDALKLQSCATLFSHIRKFRGVSKFILHKFYNGEVDTNTELIYKSWLKGDL